MDVKRLTSAAVLFLEMLILSRAGGYAQDLVLQLYDRSTLAANAGGEKVEEQWDMKVVSNVRVPDVAIYLPSKRFATGQAVVNCPGGAYRFLAYDLEGTDIAGYLNSIGIAGVVLKYRLPDSCNCAEPWNAPLQDARRALRLVRHNAARWNIDPHKIGVIGFSAGGHLASTLGTHFDYGNQSAQDSVERESCRPDFMILMYPVISFVDSVANRGLHRSLFGKNPDRALYFSSELQVRDDTPPAFLVHANDDPVVSVRNSLLMYEALRSRNIPAEMHILSEGGHGFALAVPNPHVASWVNNLRLWLGWLNHAH